MYPTVGVILPKMAWTDGGVWQLWSRFVKECEFSRFLGVVRSGFFPVLSSYFYGSIGTKIIVFRRLEAKLCSILLVNALSHTRWRPPWGNEVRELWLLFFFRRSNSFYFGPESSKHVSKDLTRTWAGFSLFFFSCSSISKCPAVAPSVDGCGGLATMELL